MHTQEEIEDSQLEMYESIKRLYKNRDFKKLILDGYLDIGSSNLVKNFNRVKPEFRDSLIEEITARSNFWKYVDTIEEDARSIIEARTM
jgi:hypothetical protein